VGVERVCVCGVWRVGVDVLVCLVLFGEGVGRGGEGVEGR